MLTFNDREEERIRQAIENGDWTAEMLALFGRAICARLDRIEQAVREGQGVFPTPEDLQVPGHPED